jgi:pyridoxamine 5'-phosphate oxidase
MSPEPLELVKAWIEEARAAGLTEHDCVALATVDEERRPSARTVSLRAVEEDSLIFTTALWTRKARDLIHNPSVAMLFHWPSLRRQISITGRAEPAERALAETIFARRDRPHQLQALVSRQGEPINDLEPLRRRLAVLEAETGESALPVPAEWGAIRVRVDVIEFWQGADDALHDRQLAERDATGWRWSRLAP